MDEHTNRKGWLVMLAGTGINLALGVLYTWSVIKAGIPASWNWTNAQKAMPYSFACIFFALAMIPAGRLQDKIGPRTVATIGGLLSGLGCIIAGLSGSSLVGFIAGFGILSGLGFGFGYAAATPPAVKWFPPQKTGLVAGIVVAGFGLASVYIAPLATWLLGVFSKAGVTVNLATGQAVIEKGVSGTMLVLGIGFLIVVVSLAQLLKNPPQGYIPASGKTANISAVLRPELTWKKVLASPQLYILWIIFFAGAAAGLTFISVAQDLGKKSLGEWAFIAVVFLAIGNSGGRILAGMISDKIGRQWTLFIFLVFQALVLFILFISQNGADWPLMMLIVMLIGANYGSNLSLFPSAAKDYFGLKNFGINYGILFSAWGAAGLVMPWINGTIKDMTGKNDLTYIIIIVMLLAGAGLTFVSSSMAKKAGLKT